MESVNHPGHYNAGQIECIDAIKSAVYGLDPFAAFCAGSAIKYIWRHKYKGGVEDIEKAIWYLNLLAEGYDSGETGLRILQRMYFPKPNPLARVRALPLLRLHWIPRAFTRMSAWKGLHTKADAGRKGGGRMAKKNHYAWWAYIKAIVREYPARQDVNLHGVALREYEAVRDAVDTTERMTDAVSRMSVIRLVHFERTHTLEGAALTVPCGVATAARWQRVFFEEVARNMLLLD